MNHIHNSPREPKIPNMAQENNSYEKVAWARYYELMAMNSALTQYQDQFVKGIMESDAPYDVKNYTLLYHRECLKMIQELAYKEKKKEGNINSFWFSGKLYLYNEATGAFKVYVQEHHIPKPD